MVSNRLTSLHIEALLIPIGSLQKSVSIALILKIVPLMKLDSYASVTSNQLMALYDAPQ
ncbi:hypothetical protein PPEP_b0290 [Pseudoalteromonas peptidolytica F12-50-A1]|uniref:Uncharacterized protein n=1 Tax=Pseudoalteromonas peptidolytica F12-50-A1 TaxID=1315280 RepID=A0A8I0T6P7_9GAMM|nr:hypothetical protein [Pseudoalteromonas peptidolytica F12-50-A1]